MRKRILGLLLIVMIFALSACGSQNNTCPNGTPFMWIDGIHCIGGQEFITPAP